MTKKYITINNMPGFMPDTDPITHDNYEEALKCLKYEVRAYWEETDLDDSALTQAMDNIERDGFCYFNGRFYGIQNA